MSYITGIGGIFFKANDPEKLADWYRKHLGLKIEDFGGATFHENQSQVKVRNDRLTHSGRRSRLIPIISLRVKNRS